MIQSSGIGTTVLGTLKELSKRESIDLTLIGNRGKILESLPGFQGDIVEWDPPIYSLKEQTSYPPIPADALLHVPHYNAPISRLRQTVVMVHDLIHLQSEEFAAPKFRFYAVFILSMVTRYARAIVTVSRESQSQLVRRFPAARNKTTVLHNGVDHNLYKPVAARKATTWRKKMGLPDSFLLAVGIGKKHKNVDFLIRSLAPLWKNGAITEPLVIAGSGGKFPEYLHRSIGETGTDDFLVSLPYIPLDEMPILYTNAKILLMPSLLEGFGFPIVEAMACGTPVMCSNVSALPEVAGSAAILFDPTDEGDFQNKIQMILGNSKEQKRLKSLGLEQSARFNWVTHVDLLLDVYRRVSRASSGRF